MSETMKSCSAGNGGDTPQCVPPDAIPRDTCPDPASACGCCAGTEPVTPQATANRPGLSALSYRIGTHSTFLETMLARLTSQCLGDAADCAAGGGSRPLAALTTRDASDPSIALLDAWATVGDVLTFYQERIANEGYLRTATERRSVLELARLIGYKPRPGVSASTYLAYTIDDNTAEDVLIPAGARVQSVPGPGELPQSFETGEDLTARAVWNRLVPRQTVPQQWQDLVDTGKLYLKGIATQLKVNDPLLVVQGGDTPQLFRVTSVTPDAQADRTEVGLALWAGDQTESDSKAARKVMQQIIEAAPEGKTAATLVEHLKAMSEAVTQVADSQGIVRLLDSETLPLVKSLADQIKTPAPKLHKWLDDAGAALTQVRKQADKPVLAAPQAAAANQDSAFSARLDGLIRAPSKPLSNALQLPRSLQSSFKPTSDAGFKALGLASPDLRANLGAMVANYAGASPQPSIEVYALRLKAGVFGRNAPKHQKTVRNGENDNEFTTVPIGEWPIVSVNPLGAAPSVVKTESPGVLYLDGNYDGVLPNSWLVLDYTGVPVYEDYPPPDNNPLPLVEPAAVPDKYLVVHVRTASKVARAEYGISGDSTRVELSQDWIRFNASSPEEFEKKADGQTRIDRDFQVIRGTAVYAQSEYLPLAEAPIETDVCGGDSRDSPLELDGLYQDLDPGRFIIVSGERSDIADTTGVLAAEALMITEVVHDVRAADAPIPLSDSAKGQALPGDRIHTFIRTDKPLSYCYQRDALTIYGNVVKATHGETRNEVLGSGDGSKGLQAFTLKQPPLTYLAAPTVVGAESTLQVFVNNVQWHEQTSFVDLAATAQAFITRTDDDGNTTVTFGNGVEGARLPTGVGNVNAIYRFGIGQPGNVRAGQLSLLSTRPHGVKEVTNPLRASGGAGRESRDQARDSAPLAVMSLDRLVSTRDYADFARSFAGIAKAAAAELSDGHRTVVHVTIAGADDIPIDATSDLYLNLRRALIDLGDPFQPIQLAVRDLLQLVISAGVRIDPDYIWENVVTDLRNALLDTFGFERRGLAQDVAASEVLGVMQAVRGVVYIDLDAFGAVSAMVPDPDAEEGSRPRTPDETAAAVAEIIAGALAPRVPVLPAQPESDGIHPAQIAVLVPELPATLVLNQIKD
jgi:hypothetical protein